MAMAPQILYSVSASLVAAVALASAALAGADAPKGTFVTIHELSPAFYTHAQICEDAKSSGKGLAIVALKSHSCDLDEKQHCLKESYYLSDPCNASVQENFAVYHLRGQRNSRTDFTQVSDWNPQTQAALLKEWGGTNQVEPEWILLDLKSCTEIRRLKRGQGSEPSELHTSESIAPGGVLSGSNVDTAELVNEYEFLAQQLGRAIAPNFKLAHPFDRKKTQACLSSPERSEMTLFDLWDLLDSQHPKTSPPGTQ